MKKIGTVVAMVFMLSLLLADESYGQRGMKWRGSGGWGMGTPYGRMYDPKTVENLSGEVVTVEEVAPMKGMSNGVHLMVKTDKESVAVHLGPGWYVQYQDVRIEPKDQVTVRGSRITLGGKPAIIAAEVTKGDGVLKLRDDAGVPMWSAWRKR